jgi:hypothetical protein
MGALEHNQLLLTARDSVNTRGPTPLNCFQFPCHATDNAEMEDPPMEDIHVEYHLDPGIHKLVGRGVCALLRSGIP